QIALVGYRDRFAHVVGRHADHIGRGGDCAWHAVLNDNGDVESTIIEELIVRKQVATKLARRFRQVSFVDNKSGAVLSGLCSVNEILIADNFHRPPVLNALLPDPFTSLPVSPIRAPASVISATTSSRLNPSYSASRHAVQKARLLRSPSSAFSRHRISASTFPGLATAAARGRDAAAPSEIVGRFCGRMGGNAAEIWARV